MLINELAKATGLSRDSIRHYQEMGLLEVEKQQAGTRIYNHFPEINVDRIQMIKMGKSMGFTLKEIAAHIDAYFSGDLTLEEQIKIFEGKLQGINGKIEELEESREYIHRKLDLLKSADYCRNWGYCRN